MAGMANLNDPVEYAIVEARVKLLFTKPFIGNIAMHLDLVDASSWCETVATDGRKFYYNRDFIKSLSKPELLFILGHDVLHVVYGHIGRRGNREKDIWDAATDFLINACLIEDSVGKMPEGGNHNKRFTTQMTSDEIYDIILKESIAIKMPLDMHLEASSGDEGGDDEDGEATVRVMGDGNGPPSLTEADLKQIEQDVRAAILSAAQAVGAGNVPAGIRRMIDELVAPKMSWKELLDTHIRSSIKDDYTFQRPGRRSFAGLIMPGQNLQDPIDVTCAIDCSGSMTQEMLKRFLSEVRGIMQTFKDFRLNLFVFDTQVYNLKLFTAENGDEITQYPMAGGGGTSFECCFDFMRQENIMPGRFVMFTDGYPNGTWGDSSYCDTLFVIYGDPHRKIQAPWGQTAHYEAN